MRVFRFGKDVRYRPSKLASGEKIDLHTPGRFPDFVGKCPLQMYVKKIVGKTGRVGEIGVTISKMWLSYPRIFFNLGGGGK